jgi:uncharacterized protein YkwD
MTPPGHFVARTLAVATSLACGTPLYSDPAPSTSASPPAEVARFVMLVNGHRLGAGCPALRWDNRVARVAQAHSADMAARGFFAHTNPDGKSPFDRLDDAGIPFSAAAENIAAGARDAERALDLWLKSPGHRANIENCSYTHHGVGLAQGRWTEDFLRP